MYSLCQFYLLKNPSFPSPVIIPPVFCLATTLQPPSLIQHDWTEVDGLDVMESELDKIIHNQMPNNFRCECTHQRSGKI